MLKLENVSVTLGKKKIVEDVSLQLEAGQWLMLCGPTGAGKSTLIRAMSRAVPYAGRILLRGEEIRRIRADRFARAVGVLPQHNGVDFAFTVEEIVRMGRYAHRPGLFRADSGGEASVGEALEITGLTDLRRASALTLSGGELQRVFLAQVFAQRPDILLLDEPANHLDLKYQQQIFGLIADWLSQGGRAVITVVHDLSLARRYGTRALLLHQGRAAAQGDIETVFSPDTLRPVYGMNVHAWMREALGMWGE